MKRSKRIATVAALSTLLGIAMGIPLATSPAKAGEIGLLAGLGSTGGANSFAYGIHLGWGMGPLTVGPKVILNGNYTNILGDFKFAFGGAFIGLSAGIYMASGGVTPGFSGVVGPCAGYYFGAGVKFGGEVDYLLPTAAGGSSTLHALAGVKISI
jgi:hypothetical protein